MNWNTEQQKIIDQLGKLDTLETIPREERRYKCFSCHITFPNNYDGKKKAAKCPQCGDDHDIRIMCPLDHCNCPHDIFSVSEVCPVCGHQICPACGTHDVAVISRVTGYLQSLDGWNEAKKQEFHDRVRYNPAPAKG